MDELWTLHLKISAALKRRIEAEKDKARKAATPTLDRVELQAEILSGNDASTLRWLPCASKSRQAGRDLGGLRQAAALADRRA